LCGWLHPSAHSGRPQVLRCSGFRIYQTNTPMFNSRFRPRRARTTFDSSVSKEIQSNSRDSRAKIETAPDRTVRPRNLPDSRQPPSLRVGVRQIERIAAIQLPLHIQGQEGSIDASSALARGVRWASSLFAVAQPMHCLQHFFNLAISQWSRV
jgi:transcriptional regulator of acetoin/glycerol metabolism